LFSGIFSGKFALKNSLSARKNSKYLCRFFDSIIFGTAANSLLPVSSAVYGFWNVEK
jgi:hypothetical protein